MVINPTDDQWEGEQQRREARIQTLYDQIEPLWGRLQLDQDQMELFMQMNLGCSEAAIKAVSGVRVYSSMDANHISTKPSWTDVKS